MAKKSQIRQGVNRYYELVDRRDIDSMLELFAEDCVYERPGYEALVGRQAMSNFYREERAISSGAHIINDVIIDQDRAAVEGQFRGTLKDGTRVDVRFSDFFRFHDHVIVERRTYFYAPSV